MKEFAGEYYIEPENMIVSSAQFEAEERMDEDDLDECSPEEDSLVEPGPQTHSSDTGEDSVVVIEEQCISHTSYKTKVL